MNCSEKGCVFPATKDGKCNLHSQKTNTTKLCVVHKQHGIDKIAWYEINGKPMCGDCKEGIPVVTLPAGKPIMQLPPDDKPRYQVFDETKGNHHILEEKRKRAEQLFIEGKSVREVARIVDIAQITAQKIRKSIITELPPCECGRPAGHRGWCKKRVQQSPARQETLKQLHENRRSSAMDIQNSVPLKAIQQTPERQPAILPQNDHITISQIRIKLEAERSRLEKELERVDKELEAVDTLVTIADRLRQEGRQ